MFGLPSNVSEALPVGSLSITTKPSETTQPFAYLVSSIMGLLEQCLKFNESLILITKTFLKLGFLRNKIKKRKASKSFYKKLGSF